MAKTNNQSKIIFTEDVKKDLKETQEKIEKKDSIPSEYIEVKLDSVGKLNAPKILHFRNYSLPEIIKLTSSKDLDLYENIIECLNDMCYEDFDCGLLTEQDIKSILLNLYGTWIDSHIRGMEYYIDEDAEDKDDKENIGKVDLLISELKTSPLPENFKEPINITIGDTTVKFKLTTFNDLIFASEYIKKRFFEQERKFSDTAIKLKNKEQMEYEEYRDYTKYVKKRDAEFLEILSVMLLVGFNDIDLDTMEKKLEYSPKVNENFWGALKNFTKDFNFGVNSEVTFKCPVNKKKITRRFQFRLEDFIPDSLPEKVEGVKISFG